MSEASIVEAAAQRAAELVLARLADMLSGPASYSTRPEGPRPAEFARRHRAWRETAPRIAGAVRDGARWWAIPRVAYEAWRAGTAVASHHSTPANAAPWSPAAAADELGLRLVDGGRK